jgi:hypothetical protein
MATGTLTQPRNQTVAEVTQQSLVKRFNTGRLPTVGEVAKGGVVGSVEVEVDGFVQKANILSVNIVGSGLDATNYTVEFFQKDGPHDAANDPYLRYQNSAINLTDFDVITEGFILEDEELVNALGTKVAKKRLHVRIVNNGGDTMHVDDIEIQFNDLKVV